MQLNCKVIKKVATPSFLNQRPLPPLFRVIAKFLVLQSDSIFGRGYPPPPPPRPPLQKKRKTTVCDLDWLLKVSAPHSIHQIF